MEGMSTLRISLDTIDGDDEMVKKLAGMNMNDMVKPWKTVGVEDEDLGERGRNGSVNVASQLGFN